MTDPEAEPTENAFLPHLFANGGEMGARIEAFDWTTTPLGAVETWPLSLQVTLQILLSSRFPMQVLWGEEYIQFYNDAYIRIAGNKHPGGLGQRGADCWREVWDLVGPMLDNVMATGTATWSEDQLLVLERNGYPEECYFTFSYTPIWATADRVGGIFIAVNETTQQIVGQQRERALRVEAQAAQETAERASQLKDRFLAVLSHELRTPLNPILGWAKLLRSRPLDPVTVERALATIERNAQLQSQMIEDLLDVSRIVEGKLALNIAPAALIPVIEGAIETIQADAADKSIDLQTQLDNTPCQIAGDANRLTQVVWNLLSNSVKFTPEGGTVTVQLSYSESFAHIRIIDTGKGIHREFLPRVFDHFQQGDSSTTKTFGGLGLGLAIAKQIVDMHGGTIQADSPGDGQGATFTVSLPLTVEPSRPIEPTDLPTSPMPLSHLRILIVEDDPDSLEILELILQEQGARITAVTSAAAALTTLPQMQPDLLISDIGMPDMDGYQLIRTLRTTAETKHIPAIALTAYASDQDQQVALNAGFEGHVTKPIEIPQLLATILSVVGQAED